MQNASIRSVTPQRVAQQADEIEDNVSGLLSADDPQIVGGQGVEGEDRRKGHKIRIVHLAKTRCVRPMSCLRQASRPCDRSGHEYVQGDSSSSADIQLHLIFTSLSTARTSIPT